MAAQTTKTSRVGRPPASTSAETRARIIDAARDCFGRYGYDKTTNQLIARQAGITSGAIYHYFESKQELFESVASETLSVVLARFAAMNTESASTVGRLSSLLEAAVDLNSDDPSMATFVSSSPIEIRRHEQLLPLAARERGETERFFTELVEDGKSRGEIVPDVDTLSIVNMLMAVTSGLALYAAFVIDGAAHRAAVHAFERLVSGTLFTAQVQPQLRH